MKIMIVVGARPNFMKAGPLVAAIKRHNVRVAAGISRHNVPVRHVLVHTGQHYDSTMSESFFTELGLPAPDVRLDVGSGSHAAQTAEIMRRFEPVVLEQRPDAVVVVGDVNSTIACAMVASKLAYDSSGARPLVAHVEAGLRSFDRGMPEEINRILTDHLSDLLFVTEESGRTNLRNEGIPEDKIHFVGNTMIDSLLTFRPAAAKSAALQRFRLQGANGIAPFALLTLHRPSNVDQPEPFIRILAGLKEVASRMPVIFPVHPRTRQRLIEFDLGETMRTVDVGAPERLPATLPPGYAPVEPLGYIDFVGLMMQARLVVTDSGGIQEETTCLGVPCVTIRENTERPATIDTGTNIVAGTSSEGIRAAVDCQLRSPKAGAVPPLWDGQAGTRIVDILVAAIAGSAAIAEVQAS